MNRVIAAPGSESALSASVAWINGLLLGSLAAGLCVIAVAIVGILMFGGRLPVRQGLRVILGCFVLLGAPIIASGFLAFWQGLNGASVDSSNVSALPEREYPPPADYDSYAGASTRRD